MSRNARVGERKVDEDFAEWRYCQYQLYTMPAIALLGANRKVAEINAELTINEVWNMFLNGFNSLSCNN
ncbi:MAG: hypothetical protein ABIJ03_01720 [Patescibacteria group bacterium]